MNFKNYITNFKIITDCIVNFKIITVITTIAALIVALSINANINFDLAYVAVSLWFLILEIPFIYKKYYAQQDISYGNIRFYLVVSFTITAVILFSLVILHIDLAQKYQFLSIFIPIAGVLFRCQEVLMLRLQDD